MHHLFVGVDIGVVVASSKDPLDITGAWVDPGSTSSTSSDSRSMWFPRSFFGRINLIGRQKFVVYFASNLFCAYVARPVFSAIYTAFVFFFEFGDRWRGL